MIMTPQASHNNIVIVEFVCRNCKEGKHGCPRFWIGLGLEIRCTCSCTEKAHGSQKENMQGSDDDSEQAAACHLSRLEARSTIVTNTKECR